ncbi:hypothetical protein BTUL_0335g00030 [Botrytis tulipae]|uniref:CRESS-DNA virus Rep endonuclease domain-containing protein n=1 Tax=Botrytis tulipae TaxID=87230 RepID=A0A4Z1ECH8_9HELO|nr:hypothetical protein BTUL_0335g00030 [Botrytis tulipae]
MPKRAYNNRADTPGSIANFIDDEAELSGSDVAEDTEPQAPKRRKRDGRFRVRAQRLLLTYSQINETFLKEDLGPWLKEKCGATTIRVALENHQDGGEHIHAYIDTGTYFIINNQAELDYCDHHPNIEAIRVTPHKTWDYVAKDGNILFEEGPPPHRPSGKTDVQSVWKNIIMTSKSADEFLKNLLEEKPRDLCMNFNQLKAFAEWKYRPEHSEYETPDMTWHVDKYPALQSWIEEELKKEGGGRRRGEKREERWNE